MIVDGLGLTDGHATERLFARGGIGARLGAGFTGLTVLAAAPGMAIRGQAHLMSDVGAGTVLWLEYAGTAATGWAGAEALRQAMLCDDPSFLAMLVAPTAFGFPAYAIASPPNTSRVGAGGNWSTINEHPDPTVVKQYNNLACGAACGEMVLKDRGVHVGQRRIAKVAGGVPIDEYSLPQALNTLDPNGGWRGGYVGQGAFNALHKTGSWVAQMKEYSKILEHAVVVDGVDAAGQVMIRDPWEGTRYLMTQEDFLKHGLELPMFDSTYDQRARRFN